MKEFLKKLLVLFLLSSVSFGAFAAKKHDEQIRKRLDFTGMNYQVTESGDFFLIVKFKDGRTQGVFVESRVTEYYGTKVRGVYSLGYKGMPNASMMQNMLESNETWKIGAWGIFDDKKDGKRAYFTAKIQANLNSRSLREIIFGVGRVADEFEKKFCFGADDL